MRAETEASLRVSVTENRAASVEWPLVEPEWFGSRRRVCDDSSVVCFKTALSVVFGGGGGAGDGSPLESIAQNDAAQARTITSVRFLGLYAVREGI